MLLRRTPLLGLALMVSLAACDGGPRSGQAPGPGTLPGPSPLAAAADASGLAPMDGRLPLAYRASAALGSGPTRLTLVAVRDSRCPADARCIQAGSAEVDLEVSAPGSKPASAAAATVVTLALPGPDGTARSATLQGYRLTLMALRPSPPSTATQAEDYVAELRIERMGP